MRKSKKMEKKKIIESCTTCRYGCKTTDVNKAYGCTRRKATDKILRKRRKSKYRNFSIKNRNQMNPKNMEVDNE